MCAGSGKLESRVPNLLLGVSFIPTDISSSWLILLSSVS